MTPCCLRQVVSLARAAVLLAEPPEPEPDVPAAADELEELVELDEPVELLLPQAASSPAIATTASASANKRGARLYLIWLFLSWY